MLRIVYPSTRLFNSRTNEFIYIKEQELCLEHSLISLTKWEQKWHKPFLSKTEKTREETIDYVRCMMITQKVDPLIYQNLTNDIMDQINEYIKDPMTATWFSKKQPGRSSNEQVTSEIIYYWMIELGIPIDIFEKRHLNSLLTLIEVCVRKRAPQKKMSQKDIMSRNAAINARNRAKYKSKG